MAPAEEPALQNLTRWRLWPRRKRWRVVAVFAAILFAGMLLGWLTRERIATNIIESQLEQMGLPATYEIGSIGPERQVLKNLVIGDPDNPDLTIESAAITLRYRLGTPVIGGIELVNPRLFGSLRDGKLSFGSLDRVIFADSDEPAALPEIDLKLIDGRALIDSDFGPIGIKVEGQGALDDGFNGLLAATAPKLALAGCQSEAATLYGKLVTGGGIATFNGPLRLRSFNCAQSGIALAAADADLELEMDPDFAGFATKASLAATDLTAASSRLARLGGKIDLTWRDDILTSRYDLAGDDFERSEVGLDTLRLEGTLRARDAFDIAQLETNFTAEGLHQGDGLQTGLRGFQNGVAGTLLEPLVAKLRGGLARELGDASVRGNASVRKRGESVTGVLPNLALRGTSGATVLAISQLQFGIDGDSTPRLSGNFTLGGRDLPRIEARMEQAQGRSPGLRLRMEPYSAGKSSLAIPQLALVQNDRGGVGLAGEVIASGAIPGGEVSALKLPISGGYSGSVGLALWRSCTQVSFDRLILANLELDRPGLSLCPGQKAPILQVSERGVRLAAGIPSLDLKGKLAGTPITLRSGAVGIAWPGATVAKDIEIALGPPDTASRFALSTIEANFGEQIGGSFDNADISLDAVPLDVVKTGGLWSYTAGTLRIEQARLRVQDRQEEVRFEPLEARGGWLTLADNRIEAQATLRHPASDRVVADVAIYHDLSSGTGHSDLIVNQLVFDEGLQPDELTRRLNGIIALVDGTVTGSGRIDWDGAGETSSGVFGSDDLDLAAAFGPVKGMKGKVVFTDLLSLTTAPGQKLSIASINPGVEVIDGEVDFMLKDGQILTVERGSWPFMGGRLNLRPVALNLGVSEQRSYIFEIVGLDAGTFVAQMELGNISASGTFDGEVPIVFDVQGNGKIDNGELVSRPPGGNLSYVGELTYEDMGAMANFAFQSLRSLDYRQMTVNMNGNLAGEIITEVRFDGVSQGAGTKRNFITRQIAGLPIEFRVNIKAAFAELLSRLKSLYDPAFVRDPRELGLLVDDGQRLQRQSTTPPDEPSVQTQESERMP